MGKRDGGDWIVCIPQRGTQDKRINKKNYWYSSAIPVQEPGNYLRNLVTFNLGQQGVFFCKIHSCFRMIRSSLVIAASTKVYCFLFSFLFQVISGVLSSKQQLFCLQKPHKLLTGFLLPCQGFAYTTFGNVGNYYYYYYYNDDFTSPCLPAALEEICGIAV